MLLEKWVYFNLFFIINKLNLHYQLSLGFHWIELGSFGGRDYLHSNQSNESNSYPKTSHYPDVLVEWLRGKFLLGWIKTCHNSLVSVFERRKVHNWIENDSNIINIVEVNKKSPQEHEGDDEHRHQRHGSLKFCNNCWVKQPIACCQKITAVYSANDFQKFICSLMP